MAMPASSQAVQTMGSAKNDSDIACLFCCNNSCNGSSTLAQGTNEEGKQELPDTVLVRCFPSPNHGSETGPVA